MLHYSKCFPSGLFKAIIDVFHLPHYTSQLRIVASKGLVVSLANQHCYEFP